MGKYHVIAPCKIGKSYHKPKQGAEPIEVEDKTAAILVKSGSLKAADDGKPDALAELLKGEPEEIVVALDAASKGDLKKLATLEKRGANRKDVLEAIEAALAKR